MIPRRFVLWFKLVVRLTASAASWDEQKRADECHEWQRRGFRSNLLSGGYVAALREGFDWPREESRFRGETFSVFRPREHRHAGSRSVCQPYSSFVSIIEPRGDHGRDHIPVLWLRLPSTKRPDFHLFFRLIVCARARMETFQRQCVRGRNPLLLYRRKGNFFVVIQNVISKGGKSEER